MPSCPSSPLKSPYIATKSKNTKQDEDENQNQNLNQTQKSNKSNNSNNSNNSNKSNTNSIIVNNLANYSPGALLDSPSGRSFSSSPGVYKQLCYEISAGFSNLGEARKKQDAVQVLLLHKI